MIRHALMLGMVIAALGAGAGADEFFVPADGPVVASEPLAQGQCYIIESRGVYGYRDVVPEKIADAEWVHVKIEDVWQWVEATDAGDLDLRVDDSDILMMGTEDGITFGPHVFSPDSVYRAIIPGQGAPITLSIYDERHDDNTGGLQIRIWPALSGDANADDIIDERDYEQLIAQFGGAPGDQSADFNGDGVVDLIDFTLQRLNFGMTGASRSPGDELGALAPEPATLTMIVAGLGFLVRLRPKSRYITGRSGSGRRLIGETIERGK